MTPRKADSLAILNRAIVVARAEFEGMLSKAGRGRHVDARRLQRVLNEIADRTNKIALSDQERR